MEGLGSTADPLLVDATHPLMYYYPSGSFLSYDPLLPFPQTRDLGFDVQILFESSSAYYVASQVVMAQFRILSS